MSVKFTDDDPKALFDGIIASMENELGEILNPGDERRIVAGNILAVAASINSSINAMGNAQLVRYSFGTYLDNLGELWGVTRLPASNATVQLKFTLAAPAGTTIIVPKGTRATPDGELYFATTQDIIVPFDTTTALVQAEATQAGIKYNGYSEGFIKTIVDQSPYVVSVSNTDISCGGSDIEDDESFRMRIKLAPERLSVAGPRGAYEYWTKTADVNIADVRVYSSAAGQVDVVVLMKDGLNTTQVTIDKVKNILSDDNIRPLTDNVIVHMPEKISYAISLTYYISQNNAIEEVAIKEKVTAAIEDYEKWQRNKLGRAINPDELRRKILNAGADRIVLNTPVFTEISNNQVGVVSTKNIIYGGLM
ncbi:MAG: baseplate J/gp47 family protein [Oscillospiraceae bacterium]